MCTSCLLLCLYSLGRPSTVLQLWAACRPAEVRLTRPEEEEVHDLVRPVIIISTCKSVLVSHVTHWSGPSPLCLIVFWTAAACVARNLLATAALLAGCSRHRRYLLSLTTPYIDTRLFYKINLVRIHERLDLSRIVGTVQNLTRP